MTIKGLPFISVTKNGAQIDVSGFVGRVWHILEQRMNFTTTYTLKPTSTYSELVATVTSGEVDLALSYVTVTWQRARIVDFTSPLLFSCYYVYIEKIKNITPEWNNFCRPFSIGIWLTVVFCCLGVAIFLEFLSFILQNDNRKPHTSSFGSSLLLAFSIFCMQGQDRLPQSVCIRVVYMTCYLSAITLSAAYSAKLVSSLTVRKFRLPFKDIEGLLADGTYKFGMARGSAEHSIVEFSKDPTLHALSENLKDPTILKESLKGLQYVCEAPFAYMTTLDYAQAFRKTISCDIVLLPNFSFRVSVAFPFAKGSPYMGLFNHNIKRMRGCGLIQKLMDDTRPAPTRLPPDPLKHMSLQDMVPLLFGLMISIVAAIVVAVIERTFKFCYSLYMRYDTHRTIKYSYYKRTA